VGDRDVIALQVVIDVDLPVAGDGVILAPAPGHPLRGQRARLVGDGAQESLQRPGGGVQVDEDERPPGGDPHRHQAEGRAVEVLDAVELGRGQQAAVKGVGPAVVVALERLAVTAALGHAAGPVPADVVKGPQLLPVANYHERLAGHAAGEVVAGPPHLVESADRLPGAGEDALALHGEGGRLGVPARGEGAGAGEVRLEGRQRRQLGVHPLLRLSTLRDSVGRIAAGGAAPSPGEVILQQDVE
jgi:hypothetical protein